MTNINVYEHATVELETTALELVKVAWQRIPGSEFPPSVESQKLIAKTAVNQALELEKELERRRPAEDA